MTTKDKQEIREAINEAKEAATKFANGGVNHSFELGYLQSKLKSIIHDLNN